MTTVRPVAAAVAAIIRSWAPALVDLTADLPQQHRVRFGDEDLVGEHRDDGHDVVHERAPRRASPPARQLDTNAELSHGDRRDRDAIAGHLLVQRAATAPCR